MYVCQSHGYYNSLQYMLVHVGTAHMYVQCNHTRTYSVLVHDRRMCMYVPSTCMYSYARLVDINLIAICLINSSPNEDVRAPAAAQARADTCLTPVVKLCGLTAVNDTTFRRLHNSVICFFIRAHHLRLLIDRCKRKLTAATCMYKM